MEKIIAYTDGRALGNPGPAAIGIQIQDADGKVLKEVAEYVGNANNNFAAYQAVATALETIKQMFGEKTTEMEVELRLDSELVKKQLNRESQIEEPGLVPLFIQIHNQQVASFPRVTFTQVTTEQNKEASRLVNDALDVA